MKKSLIPQLFLCCALLAGVSGTTGNGQNYLGAAAVLKQAQAQGAKPDQPDKKTDAQSKLRGDLEDFSKSASKLVAADAARQWLALVDRAVAIQEQGGTDFNSMITPIGPEDVLGALPPPADWSELAKAINARPPAKGRAEIREMGLRLLADTLTGDLEGRKRELANLQEKIKDANAQTKIIYGQILRQLSDAVITMSDDPEAILKSLERELESGGRERMQSQVNVPNLVAQVGQDKAEAFLRKALTQSDAQLKFENPNETSRLAQKLALELIGQLKSAQWGLVNSLDSVELYEALDKRFGSETNKSDPTLGAANVNLPAGVAGWTSYDPTDASMGGDESKLEAQVYYFLGLIAKDRAKDAIIVAKKLGGQGRIYLPENAFKQMELAGYTGALDNFFYELLSQDPTLSFWDEYVSLAAKAGQTDRMLKLARSAAANEEVSANKKASIRENLFKALLAADEVDEGVKEVRQLMGADAPDSALMREGMSKGQLGALLAEIGVLLNKPDLAQEGIDAAKQWMAQPGGRAGMFSWQGSSVASSLEEVLLKLNRGPEAEGILGDTLTRSIREQQGQDQFGGEDGSCRAVLTDLAVLYHRAGRESDVLALLEDSPNWGAKDLSDLAQPQEDFGDMGVSLMFIHAGSSSPPIEYLAANALVADGRKEQAAKIVDDLLNRRPGLDRGYELLIALEGTNAIARLDEQFSRDQFEERPLIWKAHLLRQMNQFEAAEKVARQAISIDPSDGEEGRGDRMRAYAELAEIRDARGDKKEADFYREVVKAIRLSEDADEFYKAGLLKRAIAMYKEGLTHFSDAYCIQSRLAIQLSALGMTKEAEEHYRRAYELMPDSFGRVESHCFGCEKAFDGERPQSIAEKVFTKLAVEQPLKPQVHYLLGYLREEQERWNEARTNYLEATRLDPDYLNAWVKLEAACGQSLAPAKERDQIAFNILRLDPLQRHARPDFKTVSDLAELWNAVDAASAHRIEPETNLFALTASAAAMEKKEASATGQMRQIRRMQYMASRGEKLTPAGAISETPFVQAAGQMIITQNGFMEE